MSATIRAENAPAHVRAFALEAWDDMPQHPQAYVPFWKFLEKATFVPATRQLVFGAYIWNVPAAPGEGV
jgi:hypothetical protein